ncbi:MAG TPA: alpha/beta hydrolase [Brumimicrobium sp.]|nr:alpha/beta hydrolase [Brumimicrobium sp.]
MKIIKYSFTIMGIILLIGIILGQTNLGNFDQNEVEEKNYITIGAEKIRYLQKGEGKDILFIHGTPGSIEDWLEVMDSLAQNFRVTVFDRLGHGFSTSNEYNYHLKDNAVLTEQLIDKLDLNSPLIVGHSYGGSVATFMAVHSELKDLEYVIIDSPFYELEPSLINQVVSAPFLGKGLAFLSAYTLAKSQIKNEVTPMFKSTDGEKLENYIIERQEIWSQPKVIYSNSKEIKNLQGDLASMSTHYKNTSAKMTLITVADTVDTFREGTEKLHSELKNSELIIISNTGHYIQLEQASEIINIIGEKAKD